jgi:hypothetical protein
MDIKIILPLLKHRESKYGICAGAFSLESLEDKCFIKKFSNNEEYLAANNQYKYRSWAARD